MASMNAVIEGLQILAKYHDPEDICSVCAEHDILYVALDGNLEGEDAEKDRMDPADLRRLEELGWSFESEGWRIFV